MITALSTVRRLGRPIPHVLAGVEFHWGEFRQPTAADQLSEDLASAFELLPSEMEVQIRAIRLGNRRGVPSLRLFLIDRDRTSDKSIDLGITRTANRLTQTLLEVFDRAGVMGYPHPSPQSLYTECLDGQEPHVACVELPDGTTPLMLVPLVISPPFAAGLLWSLETCNDTWSVAVAATIPPATQLSSIEDGIAMERYLAGRAAELGGRWDIIDPEDALPRLSVTDIWTATDLIPAGWTILPGPPDPADAIGVSAVG